MKPVQRRINHVVKKIRSRRKQTKTDKAKNGMEKFGEIKKLASENNGGKNREIFNPLKRPHGGD